MQMRLGSCAIILGVVSENPIALIYGLCPIGGDTGAPVASALGKPLFRSARRNVEPDETVIINSNPSPTTPTRWLPWNHFQAMIGVSAALFFSGGSCEKTTLHDFEASTP
jgi:hypothetical protein